MTDTTNALALMPPEQRAALALKRTETESTLRTLAASSADITAVIDSAGREQAHRIYITLRTARTTIEKTGKAARDDATKFSKAVIAEQERLIALVEDEEKRVLSLRDKWDAEQQRIKNEAIAAELARMDAHEAAIAAIVRMPLDVAGKPAADVLALRDYAAATVPGDEWEEYKGRAVAAYGDAVAQLEELYRTKLAAEEAAQREAEAHEAERVRLAAEQAELARQREEQAAAALRLEAERQELARQTAAAIAKARAEEIERQRQADAAAADLKRQADALAAERAAFVAEQQAAKQAQEAAAALEAAHVDAPPAPTVDAEQAEAFYESSIAATEAPAVGTAPAFYDFGKAVPEVAALLDAYEEEPTDGEIIAAYIEAFGGTAEQAIERLARFAAQYQQQAA